MTPRALAAAALLALGACRSGEPACRELLVLAAQSLETPLAAPLQDVPGVQTSFGASGALLRQIQAGAPAGLFLSAGSKEVDALVAAGSASGTPIPFARGALVVAVPRGRPKPAGMTALAEPAFKRIAAGDPQTVPVGRYAKQALEKSGLGDAVRARLLFAADAGQALAWVRSGEADAGFLYRSDADSAQDVEIAFTVPEELHEPILYVAVPLQGACAAEGRALAEKLRGGPLADALQRRGFGAP